jgi:hypothetical protein
MVMIGKLIGITVPTLRKQKWIRYPLNGLT